jgi:arylsulfatase A-like enzyme
VRPIALEQTGETRASEPESIVATLLPPADLAPWVVRAEHSKVKPLDATGGALGLYLYGNDAREIVVPGSFAPATFNQVVLTIACQFRAEATVRLERADGTTMSSEPLLLRVSSTPQRIVAPFAGNAAETAPYERIVIDLEAGAGPVCIHSIELVEMPLGRWVIAGAEAKLVRISDEERRARLLPSRSPLMASFVPERGEALVFSCGLEPELRSTARVPRVTVELRSGSGSAISTIELESDPEQAPTWHGARIELDPWVGKETALTLKLLVEGDLEAFAWVEEPVLVRRAEHAPTVVLLTSDTHRGDSLGCVRASGDLATPALDALAARGVLYLYAFSSAETTLPSHSAILSGLPPRDTRILNNYTSLDAGVHTLAEIFHDAGWHTFASVSALHLCDEISGLGQGFERFAYPAGESTANYAVDRALAWMKEVEGEPLFLWLHVYDAHTPYEPPPEYSAPYLAAAEKSGITGEWPLERERIRARYKGEITWLDLELGRLLDEPRVREGIVGFTGDHGEAQGEAGLNFTHEELYACTLRVPLILAWPGAPAGRRIEALVTHDDLGRTLLDLAGLGAASFPGRSLLRELAPDAPPPLPSFAIACAGRSASITSGSMHLILQLVAHEIGKPEPVRTAERHQIELYDLAQDPACEHDLSSERPEVAREMRRALIAWLQAAHAVGASHAAQLSDADRSHIAELGYATDDVSAPIDSWFDPACTCEQCRRWQD